MDTRQKPRGPQDHHEHPAPGPAPVGPAVDGPPQTPAETPVDPGPAPVGPAVHPGEGKKRPDR